MRSQTIPPPDADEYDQFYAGYIALVRERDALGVLRRQLPVLRSVCTGMREPEALSRYAAGKWSIKQVVGHLTDAERVFSYRLFRISRGDPTPLAGFDENSYVEAGGFDERSLPSLIRELETARASTLRLIDGLTPAVWELRGSANGQPVSVRALVHIIAGHMEHHFDIFRERYSLAVPHVEVPRP